MPDQILYIRIRFHCAVFLAASIAAVAGQDASWSSPQHTNVLQVELDASLRYGPIRGYVQTPRGGAPGTTSPQRPTFEELDIDDVLIPDASLSLRWHGHGLYAGASFVRLDGDSVLDSALISQGVSFPANTAVQSEVQLDWYRFGYQYQFSWVSDAGTRVSVAPGLGAALLYFNYHLEADSGPEADRSYSSGTPQLRLEAEWAPAGRFSILGHVFSSLPEVSNLFILSAQVAGRCRLWGRHERGGACYLGVGYDWIDFEDDQEVPNHIKAEMGPLLVFGIGASF